ncbi:MAG: hypothetical protein WCI78_15660, partial [Mycobacterium sp.]
GAIDAAEIARGQLDGRPRVKLTSVPELLAVAGRTSSQPPTGLRGLGGRLGERIPPRIRWPRTSVR